MTVTNRLLNREMDLQAQRDRQRLAMINASMTAHVEALENAKAKLARATVLLERVRPVLDAARRVGQCVSVAGAVPLEPVRDLADAVKSAESAIREVLGA